MPDASAWEWRFTAPQVEFPRWSQATPDRLAFVSNESGAWQAWAQDLSTGDRRRVTDEPVGVEQVLVAPDGRIVWWHDDSGDEEGHWVAAPAEGGEPRPLVPDVPDGWTMGMSMMGATVAVGIATEAEYGVHLAEDGGPSRLLHTGARPAGVGREWPEGTGGLSTDGRLVCIRHAEHGDILHPALRVLDVETGAAVGDLADQGRKLEPVAWSPVPGDRRLALTHERAEFERPTIWDLAAGERHDLQVDLPGAVFPLDWWPDGSALLVRHEHEAAEQLYRLDPRTGLTNLVIDPHGEITDAMVRPDGEVWLRTSDGMRPPRVIAAGGRELLSIEGAPAPEGRPYRSFWFENPAGRRIQAYVVTPHGDGPFPIVMLVHGGPEWHHRDRFEPETQALVDAGFAVALVNYRGSTGYGIAFRESLHRNIGFPESEDVVACLDALAAAGVADPDRAFFSGWSWGGYLACLNAGLNPHRWRAVFAGIPTGDYVAAHWASSPPIQAWDDAVMGGSPDEVHELYRERDPMTYVDRVRAPVLVIAGENDSRCPLEGITPWTDAIAANGGTVETYLYGTGHHANDVGENVRQMRMILEFFRRYLHD